MSNINEELLRMKFLLDYKKGRVISEQDRQVVQGQTQTKTEPGKITTTQTDTITFNKRFKATYSVGDSDPKTFINTVYTDLMTELKTQNPNNRPLQITQAVITGTASNIWKGKATAYDLENDFKKPGTPNEQDPGYVGNKNLSSDRANKFWASLLSMIQKTPEPKISMPETIKPTIRTYVINTGGKKDEDSGMQPGQTISLFIRFRYTEVTETVKIFPVSKTYYKTSTYWCDGTEGGGKRVSAPLQAAKARCFDSQGKAQFPSEIKGQQNTAQPANKGYNSMSDVKHHFITMFQLIKKDNMDIRGTWEFTWNGGQIAVIKKSVTKNMGSVNPDTKKYQVTPGTVENIIGDEALMSELATAMNFPKVQTDGKFSPYSPGGEMDSFNRYVQPYLTPSPVSNETVSVLDQAKYVQQNKTK